MIILLNILFSISISINNDSIILFKFKTISIPSINNYIENINDENDNNALYSQYNYLTFFNENYLFKILSNIRIGTPPQDIISLIITNYDKLLIGELLEFSNEIFSNSIRMGYQYNKSLTFINFTSENKLSNDESSETFIGEDNLYLYTDINNLKYNKFTCLSNFKFNLEKNIKYNNNSLYGLSIGLTLDEYNFNTNFMKQIHDKNIISSYLVSFEYINETEGIIIIGKYPHEIFPEKYKEEDFKPFYSYEPRTMYLNIFIINFDEIYSFLNKEKYFLQKTTKSNIILNSGFIIGTNEYMQFIINNYFSKYMGNDTCEMSYTSEDFQSYIIISCYDNENFDIEQFPSLNFNKKSENLTFEFTYKDLFKKINNKYYFLVLFERFVTGYWRFGKPFYLKYTFVYNGDAKTIGFYTKTNTIENEEKKENKKWKLELNAIKIIIIIILLLLFISIVIIISFYYGKKCQSVRKKRANELDDNFDYVSSFPTN